MVIMFQMIMTAHLYGQEMLEILGGVKGETSTYNKIVYVISKMQSKSLSPGILSTTMYKSYQFPLHEMYKSYQFSFVIPLKNDQ